MSNVGTSTQEGAALLAEVADDIAVQAIADPAEQFDRTAAQAEHGGAVLGEGQLGYTADAGQVVNQLAAACLGASTITVAGTEVTQAVQDLHKQLSAGRRPVRHGPRLRSRCRL